MTVREIVQITLTGGDAGTEARLTKVADKVSDFDSSLLKLVDDLRDTMWQHKICVGLAAPQVGIGLRVAVVNWSRENREDDLVLVNPVVMSATGKKDVKRESCMSIWGLCGHVPRRDKVTIRYADQLGAMSQSSFEGFSARAVQHEIDHLDGILYNRRLRPGTELVVTDLFDNDTWRVENP